VTTYYIPSSVMAAEAEVKLKDFGNIFRLDGKVAVISGGSRGLGLHSASGWVTFDAVAIELNTRI
jgi:hypothetical protein